MYKDVMYLGKKKFFSKAKNKEYHVITVRFDGEFVDFFISEDFYNDIKFDDYTLVSAEFNLKVYRGKIDVTLTSLKPC